MSALNVQAGEQDSSQQISPRLVRLFKCQDLYKLPSSERGSEYQLVGFADLGDVRGAVGADQAASQPS